MLEKAGKKKGVGYQTMIIIICTEKVSDYLKDIDLHTFIECKFILN